MRKPMLLFAGLQDLAILVVAAIGTNAMREFGLLTARANGHAAQGEFPVGASLIAA